MSFAQSVNRITKERAMRRRQLKRLWKPANCRNGNLPRRIADANLAGHSKRRPPGVLVDVEIDRRVTQASLLLVAHTVRCQTGRAARVMMATGGGTLRRRSSPSRPYAGASVRPDNHPVDTKSGPRDAISSEIWPNFRPVVTRFEREIVPIESIFSLNLASNRHCMRCQ